MSAIPLEQQVFYFTPASYTGNSQKTLFTVRDSYFLITSVIVRVETAFTGGTPVILVGTVASTNLLVTSADVTEGSTGVYKGTGTGIASGGALIAPGTAIIVDYTGHASTTQGRARVTITGHRVGI